jgi:sulfur carrier protein
MQLRVNGKELEVPEGITVAGLLARIRAEERPVAVAVNGDVVPRAGHEQHRLRRGDVVEVIEAVAGG